MQTIPENIYRDFTNNTQNTHNAALSISAANVLYRLVKHYILRQNHSPDIVVNDLITQLSKEIETQDNEVKGAWLTIQQIINEPSNRLDIVRLKVSENKEPELICFPLKTILATVYAALSDQTVYENNSDDERDLRIRSLFNSFLELHAKPECHHGARNQWAMLLHLVYPGVELILNLTFLMHRIAGEYLTKLVFSLLEEGNDLSLFREVLLTELVIPNELITQQDREDRHPWLKENLDFTCFQQKMKTELEAHGIEEEYFSEAIHTFWDSMENIPLFFDENQRVFHNLYTICETFSKNDFIVRCRKQTSIPHSDVLQHVLIWIYENFDPNSPSQNDFLAMLVQANRVYDLLLTYGRAVSFSDSSQFSLEAVEILKTSLNSYYDQLRLQDFPIEHLPNLQEKMCMFEEAVSSYKKEKLYSWIENFFVNWSISDSEQKTSLYQSFLDPLVQEKCYMTDEFLYQVFVTGNEEEVKLTPYLINRIFLHGLTINPAEWSDSFIFYFEETLQFVSSNFNQENLLGTTNNLKQGSYPDELLQQLIYLRDYRTALVNNEVLPDATTLPFIPLPHLIQNTHQLIYVLKFLPEEEWLSFVDKLCERNPNFFQSTIELTDVMNFLPEGKRVSFLNKLCERNPGFFQNTTELINVLEFLPEQEKTSFVSKLYVENPGFCQNVSESAMVLFVLPKEEWTSFIDRLREGNPDFIDRLRGKNSDSFQEAFELVKVLLFLLPEERVSFIDRLCEGNPGFFDRLCGINPDFYQKDKELIIFLLSLIPREERTSFIDRLCEQNPDFFFLEAFELAGVLNLIPQEEGLFFFNILYERNPDFCQNFSEMEKVLEFFPQEEGLSFIDRLCERNKDFFQNSSELKRVLNLIPQEERSSFIDRLCERNPDFFDRLCGINPDFYKCKWNGGENKVLMLGFLPQEERISYIDRLCERNPNFFQNSSELKEVLKFLPQEERTSFINRLCERNPDFFDRLCGINPDFYKWKKDRVRVLLLSFPSQEERSSFIDRLYERNPDFFFLETSEFRRVVNGLTHKEKVFLFNTLCERNPGFCQNFSESKEVLEFLYREERTSFIDRLCERNPDFFQNASEWKEVLEEFLSREERRSFINKLFEQNPDLFQNASEWKEVLGRYFSKKERAFFIDRLYEQTPAFFQEYNNLVILENLEDKDILLFIIKVIKEKGLEFFKPSETGILGIHDLFDSMHRYEFSLWLKENFFGKTFNLGATLERAHSVIFMEEMIKNSKEFGAVKAVLKTLKENLREEKSFLKEKIKFIEMVVRMVNRDHAALLNEFFQDSVRLGLVKKDLTVTDSLYLPFFDQENSCDTEGVINQFVDFFLEKHEEYKKGMESYNTPEI